MSSKLTDRVYDHFPYGGGQMLTALVLAEHGDPDGTSIYPSVATVARMTRQSERTVQNHIRDMLDIGWLILVKPGGGRGHPTEYRIPIERIPASAMPIGKRRAQILHRLVEQEPDEPTEKKGEETPKKGCRKGAERVQQLLHPTSTSTSTSEAAAAQSGTYVGTQGLSTAPAENGAAAARSLTYPEKLSAAQIADAQRLLSHRPNAQRILDELKGLLEKRGLADPMAMLVTLIKQDDAGEFRESHAGRVEAERELEQVEAEVAAARAAGRHV